MTFPVYVRVGPFALHPHIVFEGLGYVTAFAVFVLQRRIAGDVVGPGVRWRLIGAALVGAAIGSHVLYLFENPLLLRSHLTDPDYLLGGRTIVGGLIGGIAAVEAVKRMLHVEIRTGDLLAVPIAVGVAIGRVGCFLTGLPDGTYGSATHLPWGVDFGDGIARHPTQLYESLFLVALAVLVATHARRFSTAGDQFKAFVLGYASFRLLVEFLKPVMTTGGLSTLQWVCLAVLAFYVPDSRRPSAQATV